MCHVIPHGTEPPARPIASSLSLAPIFYSSLLSQQYCDISAQLTKWPLSKTVPSTAYPSSTRRYVCHCVSSAPPQLSSLAPATALLERFLMDGAEECQPLPTLQAVIPYCCLPSHLLELGCTDIIDSFPSTLSSTTLSDRPLSPRSTLSLVWLEFTSSLFSSTLLASSSSTLLVFSSPVTTRFRPCSLWAPPMTLRYD